MPEPPHLAAPDMGARAGLHRRNASGLPAKELQYLGTPKYLASHDPPRCVCPADLKHMLGQIQPDWADLTHRRLRCGFMQTIFAIKAVTGVHSINAG